jgi:hypothetical protein
MLQSFNITNDVQLEAARSMLSNTLRGVSAEDLKISDFTRIDVKNDVDNILAKFDFGL